MSKPAVRSYPAEFKSLTEQIDTTTSGGRLIFHTFGALAEFERDIITRLGGLLPTNEREEERGKREGPVPNNSRCVS
jgi:hypothetical protein